MTLALVQPYTPTAEDMALESRLRVCMSQIRSTKLPAKRCRLERKARSLRKLIEEKKPA